MCHLFNILVHPVAEYGSAMWWFMQAEEMERVHLWILQIHRVSWKQLPTWHVMVLCWAELLHWYNGKFPWWSPSLSADCTAMIKFPPSENWNWIAFLLWPLLLLSFCIVTKYYVIPHPKTPVYWAMLHTRIFLSKYYTHMLRKVIR